MKVLHIMPLDDIGEHDATENCKCEPTVETDITKGHTVFHRAFDGRGYFRTDIEERKVDKPFLSL